MQYDHTRIAIRERSMLETLDLALHVVRAFPGRLLLLMSLGTLPLVAINYWLTGWMLSDVDFQNGVSTDDRYAVGRFFWDSALLVYIEAPLGSIFAVYFLGNAVFLDRPPVAKVIKSVMKFWWPLLLSHVVLRGIGTAVFFLSLLDPWEGFNPGNEVFLMLMIVLWAGLSRAIRPFINELILLEQSPLSSKDPNVMTISKRSAAIHGPSSSDLFMRAIGASMIGALLFLSIYSMMVFLQGIALNDWTQTRPLIYVGLPLAMWMTAWFLAIVRYLNYLDVRIRHEGWEVQLRMRAEGGRLAGKLA